MGSVATSADRRVFFVGDSYVVGVGDPARRGWIGRLADRSDREGMPVTVYNLGVRRDTSEDVRRRWADEVAVRRVAGSEDRVVVSFGVNDTTGDDGAVRVPAERTVANLTAIVGRAAAVRLPVLVVGPPPVAERAQNRRIAALDERLHACSDGLGVPYVPVYAALAADPRWTDEVARGDGAHPAAQGYALLAELVAPTWQGWIRG
jgi:lysophospholipase L1-like esterase